MKLFDVLIIGGGPAGLTAGIYAGRSQLKVGILERLMPGGQVATTEWIENFPGFEEGVEGFFLMQKMEKQAKKFGVEIFSSSIEKVDLDGNLKKIMADGNEFVSKTVIIATGSDPKLLNVPGEKEFKGKGVSYCATCDGPFFKGKDIVVVGGGSSGIQESLYLTRFVNSIKLIEMMDHLNAERILQNRAQNNPKLTYFLNQKIISIKGSQKVDCVTIQNNQTGELQELKADGVFVWIGMNPNTQFLKEKIRLDHAGYIMTDEEMKTSVLGVYAAGDVRKKHVYQITTAVADGTIAAQSTLNYLESIEA